MAGCGRREQAMRCDGDVKKFAGRRVLSAGDAIRFALKWFLRDNLRSSPAGSGHLVNLSRRRRPRQRSIFGLVLFQPQFPYCTYQTSLILHFSNATWREELVARFFTTQYTCQYGVVERASLSFWDGRFEPCMASYALMTHPPRAVKCRGV